jgi:hypothetical protein
MGERPAADGEERADALVGQSLPDDGVADDPGRSEHEDVHRKIRRQAAV